MYLRELHIEGYKGFREPFSVSLQKGLNVIVGENASGKTAIIDAIRLLLREDEFGHKPVNESDFHHAPCHPSKRHRLAQNSLSNSLSQATVADHIDLDFQEGFKLSNHGGLAEQS